MFPLPLIVYSMKQFDAIVFTAHPDDAFIGSSGFISKLKAKGLDVLVVTATDGEYPNKDSSVRVDEFQAALDYCGITGHRLQFKDGFLQFHPEELCLSILEVLEASNPSLIITHARSDRHSDHRAVFAAVEAAVELLFHSLKENCNLRFALTFLPISIGAETLKHLELQYFCDISDYIDIKKMAVRKHASQMPYVERNLQKHIALNRFLGTLLSCEYAEGFSMMYEEKSHCLDSILSSL